MPKVESGEIERIIREEMDWPKDQDPDGAVSHVISRIVERIRALPVGGDQYSASLTGPGYPAKPEPVPVSALRAGITSRRRFPALTEATATEIAREVMAAHYDAEEAPNSARLIRAGNWDEVTPVREVIWGAKAMLAHVQSLTAPVDRSGEAAETLGSAEGESAVGRQSEAPICKTCDGTGEIEIGTGHPVTCPDCGYLPPPPPQTQEDRS